GGRRRHGRRRRVRGGLPRRHEPADRGARGARRPARSVGGAAAQRGRPAAHPARPRLPGSRPPQPPDVGPGRRRGDGRRRVRPVGGGRSRRAGPAVPRGGAVSRPAPPPPTTDAGSDPAFVPDATVVARDVSVWFGQKVALSELSCSFGAGVTGLLGPNGAGKTTLMRAITGMLPVNQGRVLVTGRDPRGDRAVHRHLAIVPEDEAVPRGLTPRQLCEYVADLHRVGDRRVVD